MQQTATIWLYFQLGSGVPSSQDLHQRPHLVHKSPLQCLLTCPHVAAESGFVCLQLVSSFALNVFDEFCVCLRAERLQVLLTVGIEFLVR